MPKGARLNRPPPVIRLFNKTSLDKIRFDNPEALRRFLARITRMAAKEALPKTPVFFGGKSAAKRRREILDIMVRLGGNTLEELGSEDREYIRGVFGNFDNFNKFRDEMMEKFDKITKEIGELNKIVNMTAQGRNTGGTREWN